MKQIFTLFFVFVVVFAQRNRNQGNNGVLISDELPTEPSEDRILVSDDDSQIDKSAERPTEQPGNDNQKDTATNHKSFKNKKPHFSNATELKEWIFSSELTSRKVRESESKYEYEGYDGWYNNRAHSSLGSIDSTLIRILPPEYSDGVYKPAGAKRPHPIEISDQLFHGELGTQSKTGKTALLVYFGQQVVEEILDSRRPSCPPEYIHLDVPKDHLYYKTMKHTKMAVIRSRYDEKSGHSPNNPRQQLNEFTPWIDGGVIYGISKSWSNLLRSFKGGKLKSSEKDHLLPVSNKVHLPMYNHPPPGVQNPKLLPITRFHSLGNPWGNESPFLLTIGVLWFRWHNFIASSLAEIHKDWSDEKIYNEARKWVIASQQQIIINEWLPAWLGVSLPKYSKYDPSIDPSISHVFQSAAMRFGHTLVPGGGYKRSRNCSTKAKIIRTCNAYWDANKYLLDGGFEELILGLASQPAEEEDIKIVEDLRLYLFGSLEFTRRDLIAINIARGRDHGLPNYLLARKALGLTYDFKSFDELAKVLWPKYYEDKKLLSKVEELYKDIHDIDIWVGGMLETNGYQPGEMFLMITLDQFRRIRDGDRFWFENKQNGLFTDEEIEIIQQLSIYDIITSVTDIKEQELQSKPFILPNDKVFGGKNPIRQIDLRNTSAVHLEASTNANDHFVLMRIPKEYDLAFGISNEKDAIDARKAKEIINTELTPYEFAEVLALRPDSLFVQQMFALVDKDNNGYISFREFLDMMVIFAKGSADQKAKLMFDMYDINRVGKLTKSEFSLMIR
ncbi:dual oxidase 2-like protein [Leptotrombidium deliense]|uniref:NAD(P)H oxidase (H2O2-forming) n=1 Tax=Leptotrombidium deliense TaxID=299467 RepID=A0A443SB19_9ACAR|nr:dual oxidase 2-like protein [Leptotrombidium deliense]